MAAYLFVNIEVRDAERYREYVAAAPHSLERFGGKYLARGGRTEKLEGTWDPTRVVIVEFAKYDDALAWWNSEGYVALKELRQAVTDTNMILVEGV
ncbi:MAG: DUF1330 domain-containing protein [Candidatus Eiseniibacteriota bacterium]